MKFRNIILFLALVASAACSKQGNRTSVASVIYNLRTDSTTALADGASVIHVSVELDSLATSDRLGVLFKISTGSFILGTTAANPADTTEIVQAQFVGKSLVATAVVQVPQLPGSLIISAQPSVPQVDEFNQYILKDTVMLLPSMPDTIILTSSSVGLASNYGSQVTFTGSLYNLHLGKVSLGYKVAFGDSLAGPAAAGGTWTSVVDTTNAASQVTGIYSIGAEPLYTPITITCTVLDPVTGAKTTVAGSTTIYINK